MEVREFDTAGTVFFDENKQLVFSCNKCESKFVRQIGFEAHVTQEHSKGWIHLDEKCIFNILKHLSPNDLVSFGQVCKRFKEKAERYVNLHNKTKPIEIYVYEYGIRFKRRYEQYFRREISSVHVYFHCPPNADLFTFIKNDCAEHLKMLGLTYCGVIEGDINDIHIGIIKERLKNVEQLFLEDIKITDIHSTLLEKCENLQSLAITRSNTKTSNDDHVHNLCTSKRFKRMEQPKKWCDSPCENHFSYICVSEKYPKLKALTFLTTSTIQWYDLEKFFNRNESWRYNACKDFQILKDICHSKVRLSVRVFKFCDSVKLHSFGDIELFATEIKNFKHLQVVHLLGNISGIHTDVRTLSAIIRAKIIFPELKKLCIFPFTKNVCCKRGNAKRLRDEELQVTEMDIYFPKLSELFIHEAIVDIKSIFNHFKQLKMFVCNTDIGDYNLFELNDARSGLKDAEKVTLFNCKDILKKKTTHYLLPENALVEVNAINDMQCICQFLLN